MAFTRAGTITRAMSTSEVGDEHRSVVNVCELLLRKLLIQEEMSDLPYFNKGKDINSHLIVLDEKFNSLNLDESTKIRKLMKTLNEEVAIELKSQVDYDSNSDNYLYLCNKLKTLFGKQRSPSERYMQMLDIKQSDVESIRDFISRIRVTGYKVLREERDSKKRESIFLMTLINGLRDKRKAELIREFRPPTIDEAFELIKSQQDKMLSDTPEESNSLNVIHENIDLRKEVYYLKRQIAELRKEMQQMRFQANQATPSTRKLNPLDKMNNPNSNFKPMKNTNSNLKPIVCFNCQQSGHMARNCRSPRFKWMNNQKFNNIEDDNLSEAQTEQIIDSEDIIEEENTMFTERPVCQMINKKQKKYPQDVIDWENYINGKMSKKPNTIYTFEVMSASRTYQTTKKPIVQTATMSGEKVDALIDTGAECNILNTNTARRIQQTKLNDFKYIKKEGSLRCANNSMMKVSGYAYLPLKIGRQIIKAKFCVVSDIKPAAIIGMKTLKDNAISIISAEDSITFNGQPIPFIDAEN